MVVTMQKFTVFAAALAASFVVSTSVNAENGVEADRIIFAQVAALEGPAADLGLRMRTGIEAAFAQANRQGGVYGRELVLESFNDSYEPDLSAEQVKAVLDDGNYIGLIGPVGTPTTLVTQPLASEAQMPFIGPFTGAGFLRDASHGNIFNFRASYDAETEEWIRYLVDRKKMTNIAILYQNDGFGQVGLAGVEKALERRGMTLTASATYERNTTEVSEALATLKAANPEAIVMVGAYAPISTFIRKAREDGMDPAFVTISFVGSMSLLRDLGPDGEGVIVSQVVPFPLNGSIPVVAEYQRALMQIGKTDELDFVSLEGFLVGKLAIEALKDAGGDLTRERYLEALNELRQIDLGGIILAYDESDNQGSDIVYMTRISASGSFEDLWAAEAAERSADVE